MAVFGHLQILKKNNSIFIFTFETLGLYTKCKLIYHRHHIVNQIVQSALTDMSNLSKNHHVIMLYIRELTGITVL